MIRIGIFNGSGGRDKPQSMIIKSKGAEPNPSTISYFASKQDKPKNNNS